MRMGKQMLNILQYLKEQGDNHVMYVMDIIDALESVPRLPSPVGGTYIPYDWENKKLASYCRSLRLLQNHGLVKRIKLLVKDELTRRGYSILKWWEITPAGLQKLSAGN